MVRKTVLSAPVGPTNLFSANLPPNQNFGIPRRDVDWSSPAILPGADPANLNLTLPASTLTLVTVESLIPIPVGLASWTVE